MQGSKCPSHPRARNQPRAFGMSFARNLCSWIKMICAERNVRLDVSSNSLRKLPQAVTFAVRTSAWAQCLLSLRAALAPKALLPFRCWGSRERLTGLLQPLLQHFRGGIL